MKTTYNGVAVPANGKAIEFVDGVFRVPDHPVIPFIEGDGTGRDIWKASRSVFDAAVEGSTGFGVSSEAPPKAFHRMVLLGEIVAGGLATMVAGEGGKTYDMFWLLKVEAVVELNTQGTLMPPITGTVATFWLWLTVAITGAVELPVLLMYE